ncbi:MAG: P-II family nitrogen regulator [Candidatus Hydrogenedentota bacterium]
MKIVRAIIRPEREREVVHALERAGIVALTKIPVTGRGRQGGATNGALVYTELAKTMLLLVLDDDRVDRAVTVIAHAAYTGNPGDGQLFVSPVEKAVRLRTGEMYPSADGEHV